MNKVFLGIGSNVGDSITFLQSAVKELAVDNKILKCSSVYESEPFGFSEQNNFLNAVILVETRHSIEKFFIFIKSVEEKLERKERFRWGPREIDLDILFFNDEVFENENITIPHKGILKRDFVYVPLLEIDNELMYPGTEKLVRNLIVETDKCIIDKKDNIKLY